ncbi:poly(A) RNA polymerase, mitochondrial [Caerostris darwini]|uniref:Poly(A) RNA polymerase, mitochondrial n=1 Tax=Caerostris darwini TaxID=1538125 RepID=A0AAV4S1P8_9ARAC|nr:poly(A) RNA polymerase, mitochondrial [Caerostris darwini]
MASLTLSHRLLIKTSKSLFGKSELICNKYRYFHHKTIFYPITSINFQIRDIHLRTKRYCSTTETQDNLKADKYEGSLVPTFQHQMYLRKKQARSSVLIELKNKTDVLSSIAACEQFGDIKNVYSYNGESENVLLLLEFTCEESVQKLHSNCQYENTVDTFPICSRIIRFDKKFDNIVPSKTFEIEKNTSKPVDSKGKTVSELIEDIYDCDKLSELDTRLRFFLCAVLKDSLSGLFPHCDALPFGSSVNGLGKQGCDLDVMIRLYPTQVIQNSEFSFLNRTCFGDARNLQVDSIHALHGFFKTFLPGLHSVSKISRARVPIIKFGHRLIGLDCDISVNNMAAILMSEILYFCGEIDSRVRPLLYAVKKWAKESNITHAVPGAYITNFGLSLLVIFFLQNRPVPILPNLIESILIVGDESSTNFKVEYLMPISKFQVKASLNTESLAELLEEFLRFLGLNPFKDRHFSILTGVASPKKSNDPICMEYPMDEISNVTKNVSETELRNLCEKARLSCKFLASNKNVKCGSATNLPLLLGVSNINRLFLKNTNSRYEAKLDVNELFNKFQNNNKKRIQHKFR